MIWDRAHVDKPRMRRSVFLPFHRRRSDLYAHKGIRPPGNSEIHMAAKSRGMCYGLLITAWRIEQFGNFVAVLRNIPLISGVWITMDEKAGKNGLITENWARRLYRRNPKVAAKADGLFGRKYVNSVPASPSYRLYGA